MKKKTTVKTIKANKTEVIKQNKAKRDKRRPRPGH